jgi:tetraacyldisaccharide 4'-kinase
LRRPLLAPLIPLYAAGAALRLVGARERKLRWPVISVGNLSVGGTGKTPFTIALALLLVREGFNVDVLSRGYGRLEKSVARVDPNGRWERYGDEPLVIANEAYVPVFVGAQRWQAGQMAEREWATSGQMSGVHLLDDGFQHRQLARDVDVVLVNGADLSDSLLPAGNLRESVQGLRRATVLAIDSGDGTAADVREKLEKLRLGAGQAIWSYKREMALAELLTEVGSRPVIAFCGIAQPQQFFAGLKAKGLNLAATRAFPDHYKYTRGDIEGLRRAASAAGNGVLVTTAKDLFRLGEMAMTQNVEDLIHAVDLKVQFDDEDRIAAWLRAKLGVSPTPLRKSAGLME